MSGRPRPYPTGLQVVLLVTALTLVVGYLLKLPCLVGPWDGRQYTLLCYSDVTALSGLAEGGRVPEGEADKYPALANYLMVLVAAPARSFASFFNWTAVLWTGFALLTSWTLYGLVGPRALFFAAAPTLAVYGFMNWDLPLVALATLGTAALLRDRDGPAGIFLGLGSAVKIPYPGFLAIPFAAWRLQQVRTAEAWRLVLAAGGAWAAVNLPFALGAPDRWFFTFRFNAGRSADWDTVWFLIQHHVGFVWPAWLVNLLALAAFVAASVAVWRAAARRRPGFPAWTLGLPITICYLLTGKVYSPQWDLWLLPWFALALPDWRLFAAFQAAGLIVFITRFLWFARLSEVGGLPFGAFEVAILLRAAVLVACLIVWVRRGSPAPERQAELVAA